MSRIGKGEYVMTEIEKVLACKVDFDDGVTIKRYLEKLLERVWREGESFSGKRPFGDSGWEGDLHDALARERLVNADIEKDGADEYFENIDTVSADKLIFEAIAHVFK